MRRSDREITHRERIDEIIRGCEVCHLGMADRDQPYVVPVSFGYDGQDVYFHSGRWQEDQRHHCQPARVSSSSGASPSSRRDGGLRLVVRVRGAIGLGW
jgi:hypothetical protein